MTMSTVLLLLVLPAVLTTQDDDYYTVIATTTTIEDDSQAKAICSDGYMATECSCPYGMGSVLDGVQISSNTCTCAMSSFSPGQYARAGHISVIAKCTKARTCLTKTNLPEYTHLANSDWVSNSRELNCPTNYEVHGCYLTSAWAHTILFGDEISQGKMTASGSCSNTPAYDTRYMLSAVCRVTTEYWYENKCSSVPETVQYELIPVSVTQHKTLRADEASFKAAHAIDKDLSTQAASEVDGDGKVWLKLEFGKTNFIQTVTIYWLSYVNPYDPTNFCVKSESNYRACKNQHSNVDIAVYQGDKKQGDCGTLQLQTDYKYPEDQIYSFDCSAVGDTVLLSKTSGHIVVLEIVVTTSLDTCSCDSIDDRFELTDMDYDTAASVSHKQPPIDVSNQEIDNESSSTAQTITFTATREVSETASFSHTAGASVTVGTSFKTGVPFIASGSVSVDVSVSYEFSYGTDKTETKTVAAQYQCTAPAYRTVECHALLFKYKTTIPYTQTWTKKSDKSCQCKSTGVLTEMTANRMTFKVNEKNHEEDPGDEGTLLNVHSSGGFV